MWRPTPASLLLLLLLLLLPACQSKPIGVHAAAIVNGVASLDHPEVVFLHNEVAVRSCSGTVISRRVVVTAKHCLIDTVGSDWMVAVGDLARPPDNRVADLAVSDMRLAGDPEVLVQGSGEDSGVLILSEDFEYGRADWAPTWPAEVVDGSNITLRAYGDTDPAEDIVTFGRRMERHAPLYNVQPGTFEADVGGCNGDSGGPGLDDAGRVLGVASYADLPSCGGWTRFERLDAQAPLIQQAIDDSGGLDAPAPDPDAGPGGDGDGDADADADQIPNGDAGLGDDEPPPDSGGGCSCRFVR